MYWVAFDGEQAPLLLEQSGFRPDHPFSQGKMNRTLFNILEETANLMTNGRNHEGVKLTILLYRMFDAIQPSANASAPGGKQSVWLHRAKEYMEMHYAESISVENVAAYVGFHRSHCCVRPLIR